VLMNIQKTSQSTLISSFIVIFLVADFMIVEYSAVCVCVCVCAAGRLAHATVHGGDLSV
jgi:uncharacterized membrane protein YecN with MAPEG domain